jgi:two-component system, cell cycle sensor histidine kinase and response regulator CckA
MSLLPASPPEAYPTENHTLLERERLLAAIAQRIRRSIHLNDILQTTVTEVRQWLQVDRVLIFQFAPDWTGTVTTESVGLGWSAILTTIIRDNCFATHFSEPYRNGRISAIPDVPHSNLTPCYIEFLSQFQVQASLTIPILHGDQLWGLLIVHHCAAPRPWNPLEIDLLQQLATQVAIAIQQSTLFEQLQHELLERQQTEIALRQSEQKFRAIFDGTFQLMGLLDTDGHILEANRAALDSINAKLSQVIGKPFWTTPWWSHSPQLQIQLQEAIIKAANGEFVRFEADHILADGTRITVDFSLKPVTDETGKVIMLIPEGRDITEKKQLQTQVFRNQRLESLGTLASGIAHDLNNILTPILATAQLLPLKNLNLDPTSHQLITLLESSARRGADLVKQILSFARGIDGERTLLPVHQLLQEVTQIAKSTFPKSIEVILTEPTQPLTVLGNVTHLNQVLTNLCVNARDAMPNGGQLHITAAPFIADSQYCQTNLDAKVGTYVMITISDTGVGIPPEILERIFEPFFTTKSIGQGTGLGLSTTLGIIKSHNGFITVNSTLNEGSQFHIYLPHINQIITQSPEEIQSPSGNGECILIVDDESLIREVATTSLENYGYQVITARDGIEAIALYAQRQTDIAIVLLDIMMPSMDGITAIRTLAKINPQVKIIATSGGVSDKILDTSTTVKAFLPKPFTLNDLLTTLSQTLTSSLS